MHRNFMEGKKEGTWRKGRDWWNYWMTLSKKEDIGTWNRKHYTALWDKLALAENMDHFTSQMKWWMNEFSLKYSVSISCLKMKHHVPLKHSTFYKTWHHIIGNHSLHIHQHSNLQYTEM
jgi:hypothetical protein